MNSKIAIKIIPLTLLFLFFVTACKKDKRVLDAGTQPGADELAAGFDASMPVYGYTQKIDSIASYNLSRYKFLGCNNDPDFGKTDVGLYVNANMEVTNLTFDSKAVFLSGEIVLALDYTEFLGNLNAALTCSVYTIDSVLNPNRLYYTSNKRLHSQAGLNKVTTVSRDTSGVIRIPVDSAFAASIFRTPQLDNTVLQSKCRGFYIRCANQNGSDGVIYRVDLENEKSGFFLNYKDSSQAWEYKKFRFQFNGSSAVRYNTVTNDYSQANIVLKNQLSGDTALGAESVFIKGMGATRARILIPELKSYADSFKVSVNRAELTFHAASSAYSGLGYLRPAQLVLWPCDSTGKPASSAMEDATDLSRFDGTYNLNTDSYTFNIALYVQSVLSGRRKNYGLLLLNSERDPALTRFMDLYIGRVALNGRNKTSRPVLNMTYVKFRKD